MRLLVSVRSASEVAPALAGGADIIDAKEPSRGSLGMVAPEALAQIAARVPKHRQFSVALGDLISLTAVRQSLLTLPLPLRSEVTFVKLGFAGIRSSGLVKRLIRCAVTCARQARTEVVVIPVAYADYLRANAVPPRLMLELAGDAGAGGVLVDTYLKDGAGLLRWLAPVALAEWTACARSHGLISAVAGGLQPVDLDAIRGAGPDVVGVRGAACEGGREGRVSLDRVRSLREFLGVAGPSASVGATA